MATPLTGHMAWAGASNQVGAESAIADLNGQGGVLGERVKLLVVDDACGADQAVAAARRLLEAGVALVIGHHCSIASIPASRVYAEAGVLMISPFSTNPKLTEQGFPTVFRICGRDDVRYAGSFGLGTFRSYAVVQVWAQAVEQAGTFAPGPVAEALRTRQFDTVLGRIGFDRKVDVTGYDAYVCYVWQDGEFASLDHAPGQ